MDTITHTFFGLALYGAVDKSRLSVKEKRTLLATSLIGSQIPDIDVISALWDTGGQYQMWHRGITHSVFLVPVWAALIAGLMKLLFRFKGWLLFVVALIAVFIHNTTDIFNAWGTGYLEPFSQARLTFGTVPIVDLTIWTILGSGYAATKLWRYRWPSHQVYRVVWAAIACHVVLQTAQGAVLYHKVKDDYTQVALSAGFVPATFTVVGKQDGVVELRKGTAWGKLHQVATLESKEDADLEALFERNPKAATLYQWSPFVVVVDEGKRIGIYDPRFYRNGQSFLFEYTDFEE